MVLQPGRKAQQQGEYSFKKKKSTTKRQALCPEAWTWITRQGRTLLAGLAQLQACRDGVQPGLSSPGGGKNGGSASSCLQRSSGCFLFHAEGLKWSDGLAYGQGNMSFAFQNWMSPLCFANTETGRTGITFPLTLGLAALFPCVSWLSESTPN